MSLIWIDVESTGLDPDQHEIFEIAYAIGDGEIRSSFVPHLPPRIDPDTRKAFLVNNYLDRVEEIPSGLRHHRHKGGGSWVSIERELRVAAKGATIAGANPDFDARMLHARWGYRPWHHRMLDVESAAMLALGLDQPPGLADIAAELGIRPPDHTAAGDVQCARACWQMLKHHFGGPIHWRGKHSPRRCLVRDEDGQ